MILINIFFDLNFEKLEYYIFFELFKNIFLISLDKSILCLFYSLYLLFIRN